jgi:histidinol-phosphatase (PHP family)
VCFFHHSVLYSQSGAISNQDKDNIEKESSSAGIDFLHLAGGLPNNPVLSYSGFETVAGRYRMTSMPPRRGYANFHTHARYCDGQGELKDYVQAALELNFEALGFSCHNPLPFPCTWTMAPESLSDYLQAAEELKKSHGHRLELLLGLEIDYIPGLISPASPRFRELGLDFTIGSVHFLGQLADGSRWTVDGPAAELAEGVAASFAGDMREAVRRYYELVAEMVTVSPPDMLGHFDLIKKNNREGRLFSEEEDWYRACVQDALNAVARSGVVLEVNTGGLFRNTSGALYPSAWIITECLERNIPLIVNSDAHKPGDLDGCFARTYALLSELGARTCRRLGAAGWQDIPLEELTPPG